MKIVFFLGYASLKTNCYGSEKALVLLAREFERLGHSVSVVTNEEQDVLSQERNLQRVFDVCIISRYINTFLYTPIRSRKTFIWIHDVTLQFTYEGMCLPSMGRPLLECVRIDGIVVQTEWHRQIFKHFYPKTSPLTIGNGIDLKPFEKKVERIKGRFIYTSSPQRGLSTLLKLIRGISKFQENFHLMIFRGPEEFTKEQLQFISENKDIVTYAGRSDDIATEFLRSEVWLYPTNFNETYCLSAVEAQAAGCFCICTPLAALRENVKGYFLRSSLDDTNGLLSEIQFALETPFRNKLTEEGRQFALQQSWESKAKMWIESIERD